MKDIVQPEPPKAPMDYLCPMLEKLKPAVPVTVLLLLSGILWVGVAIMLDAFAAGWLSHFHGHAVWIYPLAGFLAALVIHHFGFLRVVNKNLHRLSTMEGKVCAFAFMSWKSYLIVMVMVGMGIGLRHSPIPKQYLSILYIGIGLALFLSSLRYFRVLIRGSLDHD
jgi:hypothetical protein